MTPTQKIIKNIALVFALFLALQIIVGIVSVVMAIFGGIFFIDNVANSNSHIAYVSNEVIYEDEVITSIDVEAGIAKVNIVDTQDSSVKVEYKNYTSEPIIELKGEKLVIKEKNTNFNLNNIKTPTLNIYVPINIELENLNIENGISDMKLENLFVKELNVEVGAGKAYINSINAETANIQTGVGKSEIISVDFGRLDLDCGVGALEFRGNISKKAKIDAGVGDTNIYLNSALSAYNIRTEMGIGSIMVNDIKCKDSETYGDGDIDIVVSGGIGKLTIKTSEESATF